MKIRKVVREDKSQIYKILRKSDVFTHEEIDCAIELLDIYLNNPNQKDYDFLCVVDNSDHLIGYLCYGKVPFTDEVYDLYWIAVDTDYQKLGIGSRLVQYLEKILTDSKARMLLIDTASKESYSKTRNFYQKNNFAEMSRLKDFYRKNDDRITYGKVFRTGNTKPAMGCKINDQIPVK